MISSVLTWTRPTSPPSDEPVPAPPRAVVTLSGELDLAAARELPPLFDGVEAGSPALVLVDASRVVFIDAAGLRALLAVVERLRAAGHRAHLHRPSPPVLRLLAITGTEALLLEDPAAR